MNCRLNISGKALLVSVYRCKHRPATATDSVDWLDYAASDKAAERHITTDAHKPTSKTDLLFDIINLPGLYRDRTLVALLFVLSFDRNDFPRTASKRFLRYPLQQIKKGLSGFLDSQQGLEKRTRMNLKFSLNYNFFEMAIEIIGFR